MIAAQKTNNTKPIILVACDNNFLGWVLTEFLLQQNCRVFYLGNFSPQEAENLSYNPDFRFFRWDFESPLPAEIFQENISYIFDLTENRKANFSLLSLAKNLRAKILIAQKKLDDNYLNEIFQNFPLVNFRLVFLPEVYGPRMPEEKFKLLKEKNFSPPCIYVTDAAFGLLKAMFLLNTKQKAFYLSPSGEKELKWQPETKLEEGIAETERYFSEKTKFFPPKKAAGIFEDLIEKKPKKKKEKSPPRFWFLLLIAPLALGLLYFFNLFLGIKALEASAQDILKGNFKSAEIHSKRAQKHFSLSPSFKYLQYAKNLSLLFERGSVLGQKSEKVFSSLISDESSEKISVSEIKADLDSFYFDLSVLEKNLKEPEFKKIEAYAKGNNLFEFFTEEKISEIKRAIVQAKIFLDVFPSIVGENEKKTYLVLFQNSAELRPTGGFIGSFALLSFNKGKLIDFEVQDVYWADGQLKGHVEPPEEIKKYLGEANWYLRDVNWDPDFPATAQKAEWFLEKETGRTVDGVVGINLYFAQRLIRAIGEIEVPDFKEKITADNFFERAQYYAETNFFPGSTQKQDFLGKVARVLFQEIKEAEGEKRIKIAESIYLSLTNKDVLIYLNDSRAMKIIAELNWDGAIREVSDSFCRDKNCLKDYLMIVEANLGVNKANYFVERKVKSVGEIDEEGKIKKTVLISYQNKSPSERFPGGRYKNYLRILTPLGSTLDKVFWGGREIKKEDIKEGQEKKKTVFGFLIEVLPGETKELEVSYYLPQLVTPKQKNNWLFLVQKQSGTKPEEFTFVVKAPGQTSIIPYWPNAVLEEGQYIFNLKFDRDLIFDIGLVKN